MSTHVRSAAVLVCDECGTEIDSTTAEVTGAMALRIWASQKGWHYVQAMVPVPPEAQNNRRSLRRAWDFCPNCGIPAELHTTINVLVQRDSGGFVDQKLPVTLVGAVTTVTYGEAAS